MITIAPFLSTFEKGQDIVRGLFDYSVLALLLLFMVIRDKAVFARKPLMGCVFVLLFLVAVADLQNILSYKGWLISWRVAIPFITCSVAIVLLKPVKSFSLHGVSFFLFIALMSHLFLYQIFPSQPIFEFPIVNWLTKSVSNPDWARNHLTQEFRERNNATDSVSVTRYCVDTNRSNVVILVESWGIPIDSNVFAKELAVFDDMLKNRGIHFRMYSRTRTAEREDLLDSAWRDSTRRRDSLFMPRRFAGLGYRTSFLFGGDSTIQWRNKYIRNIGFQQAFWTDSATADAVTAAKIDSILSESDSVKHFVAWTTRDTRFPISDDPVECEKLYYERLFGTLRIIADLAKKHTNVRFIVQGDHEPILSPLEFQRKFYRRWVPFVVLN
jgi:hypothetical protein